MIKIKEIRINGIRGFNFLKDEYGNSSPHRIELNNQHLFLYGENGAGKSSFCDAIEWCLTGNNQESNNRKIKNNKDFLVNKFCASQDNPYVEIVLENGRENCSFKRELKGKKIGFDYEDEAQDCIIEAGRIEKFVIDTKGSLWQRFSSLLGFEDLISFDDKISRLEKESNKSYIDAKKEFEKEMEINTKYEDYLNGLEKEFAERLGVNWENTVGLERDENDAKDYSSFNSLYSNAKNYTDSYNKLAQLDKDLNECHRSLEREMAKTSTSDISKIVDEADKYFEKIKGIDVCPLCGNKIKFEEVRLHLQDLKNSLINVNVLELKISKLNHEKDTCISNMDLYRKDILAAYTNLYNKSLDSANSMDAFYELICGKIDDIGKKIAELSAVISLNKQITLYQDKKIAFAKEQSVLKTLEFDVCVKGRIYSDILSFKKIYINKYSELIKQELKQICEGEISAIYNSINQSNEEVVDKFIIEPNIESKEIEFSVQMKANSKKVSALEILSTGHLRCLGFALLIARIKVKVKNLGFIIVDDPIYSIDHEHRYNLIQYLKELSKSHQLLITSSDRLFYDIIRNSFNTNKCTSYKIYLTIQDGIVTSKELKRQNQYIDEAKKYLEANDFRAASLYARLSLETKFFEIAKKLKLEIPINRMEKITIKELMSCHIKENIKSKNFESATKIDQEFGKLLTHRYFRSLLDGFPLDEEIHHPHEDRNIYSKQEIESAICTIRDFTEFIDSLPFESTDQSH